MGYRSWACLIRFTFRWVKSLLFILLLDLSSSLVPWPMAFMRRKMPILFYLAKIPYLAIDVGYHRIGVIVSYIHYFILQMLPHVVGHFR